MPPEFTLDEKATIYKNCIRHSRLILLQAQNCVGPMDVRWKEIDKAIELLEAIITKKDE